MEELEKKCYLIINPNRFPGYVKILKKIVKKYTIFKVIETENLDHFLSSIDKYYFSLDPYLLVWGGDGTIHEAINRLTTLKLENGDLGVKRAVGFLRGGSGNGIQDSYEVPFSILKQVETYVESIEKGCYIDVDLIEIKANDKLEYTQLSGIGLDAKILRLRNKLKYNSGKRKGLVRPGLFNYFLAILKAVKKSYHIPDRKYKIYMKDGKYKFTGNRVNAERRIDSLKRDIVPLMVEIGNRPYFAALYKVCPNVVCNSESLDVIIYKPISIFLIFRHLINLWKGEHNKMNNYFAQRGRPIIEQYEIKSCVITSDKPFYYHVDGDLRKVTKKVEGEYRIDYNVLPKSITFLVPRLFYNKFHPKGVNL